MAVGFLNSRRAWWKMHIGGVDATDIVGSFVSGFTIKDTILPKPKRGKGENAPSEATINFMSKDYIEDFFIPGATIAINAGYDRIMTPKVFEGVIMTYPDGQAKEMQSYTVKAYGDSSKLALKEKIRTFTQSTKSAIVAQIASENGWALKVKIKDTSPIKEEFAPIQNARTDIEFLWDMANKWRCAMWFDDITSTLYFCDESDAYSFKPLIDRNQFSMDSIMTRPTIIGGVYMLGYRQDFTNNNVECVKWKHDSARGAEASDGGVGGFNEMGDKYDKFGKILALGRTWELKPEYRKEAINKPWLFAKYAMIATKLTLQGQGYAALKKFYYPGPFGDSMHNPTPSGSGNSGFEIEVELKEGVPSIKPPFEAKLYHGSYKFNADSSFLPSWLAVGGAKSSPIKLFVNSTELSLDHGMLRSKFNCSILNQAGGGSASGATGSI